jgi:hypothetical protein
MTASLAAALALAAVVLALKGVGEGGVVAALRATARLSYLLFWPAYAGGALSTVFGPSFAPIARRARSFGLGFAAAHLVHLGLVAYLYQIATRPPLSREMFVFFSCAALCVYLLALLSIPRFSRMIGPFPLRLLRTGAIEYIALAFLLDFTVLPLRSGIRHPISYLPFALLAIAGPILRIAALVRRPRQGQLRASP